MSDNQTPINPQWTMIVVKSQLKRRKFAFLFGSNETDLVKLDLTGKKEGFLMKVANRTIVWLLMYTV